MFFTVNYTLVAKVINLTVFYSKIALNAMLTRFTIYAKVTYSNTINRLLLSHFYCLFFVNITNFFVCIQVLYFP